MHAENLLPLDLPNLMIVPKIYRAWEASFIDVIEGLDLTAGEELDLLAKWLGRVCQEIQICADKQPQISPENGLGQTQPVLCSP